MSWTTNNEGECNNRACQARIYWNPLVKHPITGRSRPLNEPYYPDQGQEPNLHLCMEQYRPGEFINKYGDHEKVSQIREQEEIDRVLSQLPRPPVGVRVGQTHLYYEGEWRPLLKCPYCHFRNIHESEITHHIRYTDNKTHRDVDPDMLDRSLYIAK